MKFYEITKSECDPTNIKTKKLRKDVTMKNVMRKKTDSVPSSPEPRDLRAEVEKRAYQIWLNERGGHGCVLDHWLRAERELAVASLGGH